MLYYHYFIVAQCGAFVLRSFQRAVWLRHTTPDAFTSHYQCLLVKRRMSVLFLCCNTAVFCRCIKCRFVFTIKLYKNLIYTLCLKKQYIWLSIINSATVNRFTKFFHCQIPEEILHTNIIKILHLTLSMFLHYLVKLESYNAASDFNGILRVRNQNWKTVQQCSVEGAWCQWTEAVDDWRVTWAAADSHWWHRAWVSNRNGCLQHLL